MLVTANFSSSLIPSTMKMQKKPSTETSVVTGSIGLHIQKEGIIHSLR
jgi:hypothetical protein